MTEFENIAIGKSSIPALGITVIVMIVIPVAFFIYWRINHRDKTNISYLVAGAVGFIVSARVLELGVHYFCILADNPVSAFINGHTAVYVIYGTVMAGVFEEGGRYIILKFIMKKNRTRENAVLYGIGHGGIEILTVLLPAMMLYFAVAVLFSTLDVKGALSALNITEETAAAAFPSIQAAAAFDYPDMAMNVIERLFAILVHIGFTIVVFYGIKYAKGGYLILAILLHMAVDTFPALYQKGEVPLWAVEVWAAIWTVITLFIAIRLYKNMGEDL
ncbi:MAG: YhfC family intramembrane metalloprotease [Lachnospiraceae bacterium]|nr:YhfC family intramembrane metalloprotease [Lachnospiraceae bacterium]